MKLSSALWISTLGLWFCVSCGNDPEPAELIDVYTKLNVGNFWIYDWYSIDGSGVETYLSTDTLSITKDTVVSNTRMFIRSGTKLGEFTRDLLFDSANTLYTYPEGDVLFTLDTSLMVTKSFGTESTPAAIGNFELDEMVTLVEVPAGLFACLNFTGQIESTDPNYEFGPRDNDNSVSYTHLTLPTKRIV